MNTSTAAQTAFQDIRIAVDGHAVSGRVGGRADAAPLVLIHSLLADQSSFDRIAEPLAATHRVLMLNLPGFGDSAPVQGGIEAVADRVAQAIAQAGQQLGFRDKPIVLGNGFGGFVTLTAAIRHPQMASKLVLADCGAAFDEPGRAAFRGMSANAAAKGLAGIAEVAMRRLFAPEFQAAHPELIAQRRERFLGVDIGTFHAACAALAALDLRPQLASMTLPALVLVGEHDEATPPRMSEELAAGLPNARFHLLKGCAHVPQLQDPEQFLAAIKTFIA